MSRESRSLFTVALAGFAFLGVGIVGGVIAVVEAFGAALEGWALAAPGLVAGTLACVAGASGYVLAREHSRAILEKEGLLLELEGEFAALRQDTDVLGEAHGRLVERTRLDGDTLKEFVKEQRTSNDQALALIEHQKQKIAALEARLAELETQLHGKAVRLEVSR